MYSFEIWSNIAIIITYHWVFVVEAHGKLSSQFASILYAID